MDNSESGELSEGLRRDIGLFMPLARALGANRESLSARVLYAANQEIAPVLNRLLRAKYRRYSILTSETEVRSILPNREVAADFAVNFRLGYNKKPIDIMSRAEARVSVIRACLNPEMNRLAGEYGLSGIDVYSEPVEIP